MASPRPTTPSCCSAPRPTRSRSGNVCLVSEAHSLRLFTRAGALPFLALMSGMSLSSLGYTQELHPDIPTYAHYSATEQGWACDDGFKQVAGFCVGDLQNLPSQNAVEVFDGQWRCRPGYHRTNGIC